MFARRLEGGAHGAAVVVAVAALVATPAAAQIRRKSGYRLELHALADPSCPDEEALRKDVLDICGVADPLDPKGQHVIRVVVQKRKRYQATIELVHPDGSVDPATPVTVEGLTCGKAMFEAATAVSALIPLDLPSGAAQKGEASQVETKPEPPAPSCDAACKEAYERGRIDGRREREREMVEEMDKVLDERLRARGLPAQPGPRHARRMTLPFAVGAGGVISIGYALDVAPGFAVGVEWRPAEVFSLGVDARVVFPAPALKLGSTGELTQDISIYSALISPCLRLGYVVGCGAMDIGAVYLPRWTEAGGAGSDWRFRLAFGPRFGVDIPIAGRLSARVLGDVLFSTERVLLGDKQFPNETYITPAVSGFVTAGLTLGF